MGATSERFDKATLMLSLCRLWRLVDGQRGGSRAADERGASNVFKKLHKLIKNMDTHKKSWNWDDSLNFVYQKDAGDETEIKQLTKNEFMYVSQTHQSKDGINQL
jgi:hypothetical protein